MWYISIFPMRFFLCDGAFVSALGGQICVHSKIYYNYVLFLPLAYPRTSVIFIHFPKFAKVTTHEVHLSLETWWVALLLRRPSIIGATVRDATAAVAVSTGIIAFSQIPVRSGSMGNFNMGSMSMGGARETRKIERRSTSPPPAPTQARSETFRSRGTVSEGGKRSKPKRKRTTGERKNQNESKRWETPRRKTSRKKMQQRRRWRKLRRFKLRKISYHRGSSGRYDCGSKER